jgi:hypothetical protein
MKTRQNRKTGPLAFALLLALAPTAVLPPRAAFAESADDAATKMARQRFQEGVGYYDKGQFEMARAAFLQAYALHKHPAVLLNLAQSSVKSGHALEASRYFQQFLKDYGSNATEAQRTDANKGLNEARAKLGRIDVVGATTGADVFIDDERIGMAPLDHSVDVEPGSHTVRLQGAGADQTVPVTASAGQAATARFGATYAAPAPAAAAPVPAETTAEPPAAPPPAEEAPAPPPPAAPAADEPSGQSHYWGWVVATGIVTIAGFTVAAVMGSEKSSAQNSANTLAATIVANGGGQGTCYSSPSGVTPVITPSSKFAGACNDLASDNNNVNADATIANIGIAVGVIGAVGLVTSTIIAATSYGGHSSARAKASPPSVVVAPLISRDVGGLTFSGSF